MRDAPRWFSAELARIGGLNPYGEPIFRLMWSTETRMLIGGRFERDGYTGYRNMLAVAGAPCWALMIWEPPCMFGSPLRWEWDYRDEETGLLDCGGFPQHGRYRLLQKFIHHEIENGSLVTYRMEPCGFMLEVMLPMLKAWMRLTNSAKHAHLLQEERLQKEEVLKKAKDLRSSIRVRRGSALVAKRAEIIERGMKEAMRIASGFGLGMRMD